MLAIRYCLFLALMTVVSTSNEVPMFGIVGRSVRLPCNIPIADRPIVEWSDMVWTSDANPSLIFRSERNPEFEIHAFHQNANNYIIDNDFALTIDGLDMDADPGKYICRSIVDGSVFERHYYLTVGELPTCSGDVLLSEGQSTTLECEMTYSGQQPLLQWFRGGQLVQSDDEYDIRLAKKVVLLEAATENDDGAEYACRMSLGDMAKDCSLILNVTYLVRDIKFLPEKEKFRVGDELKCSAKGNPVPRISLLPKNVQSRTGPGWQSLIIGQNWEGQRVTVQCTAKNSIGSDTETLSSNLTIHVTAPKKHTTPIHSHEEHQNMRSVRPTTPSPTVMRKEKEHTRPGGHHKKHHSTTTTTARGPNAGGHHPLVPEADIEQHDSNRNAVTYRVNHEKTDRPVIKTMDGKERQRPATEDSAPDGTGTKPVQNKSNEAGHMKQLSYSTVLTIVLLVHLILSRILN